MNTPSCIVCGLPMAHARLRGYYCLNERHNALRHEIEEEARLTCRNQPTLDYAAALKIARQRIVGRDPSIVVIEE